MARFFMGVFPPDEIVDYITFLQGEVSKLPIKCKFVERENLHISLSFLGEVPEEEIPGICERLDFVCSEHKKFTVNVSKIKLIPDENFVRVIVLDVVCEEIFSLSENIVKKIGGDAKPPHITLCRISSVLDKDKFVGKIHRMDVEGKSFPVRDVSLIQSVLGKGGPVYTVIHKSQLK